MIPHSILLKIDRTAEKVGNRFPHITSRRKWITTTDGQWTGGYWIGVLWFAYVATKDEKYREVTGKWLKLLAARRKEKNPDLGHLFYPSFVLGYLKTGDSKFKKIALEAADTLTKCFSEKSGLICKEIGVGERKAGRALIDYMACLPLLWWAHEETGDEKYRDVAFRHSSNTVKNFIRGDGSTFQVVDFEPRTGRIIRKTTSQGYDENSCWSRGQAWGVYGFTLAYGATGEKSFLSTAEKLSDFFIDNLPADFVPYWDFNAPATASTPKDSSAAAIACSGLLDLFKLSGNKKFRNAADNILNSLTSNYMAEEGQDGILKHGCYHMPKKVGVDEGLIWGDYYFIEAIMKSGGSRWW